jgi:probable F420-dependent oxidoreductase
MREVITALRAIWDCWQNGTALSFSGNEYAFSLMPPEFNPGPVPGGPPKINLAGINPNMVRLAGEMADGFLPHGFNSDKYMTEAILPNLEAGARRAGRTLKDLEISGGGSIISGRNDEELAKNYEAARRRISFYGSTRAYFAVWEIHGWQSTGEQLREMSFRNRWSEMPGLITDEMVDALCLITTHDDLPSALQKRYGAYATRVSLEFPRDPEAEAVTKKIIAELHAQTAPV